MVESTSKTEAEATNGDHMDLLGKFTKDSFDGIENLVSAVGGIFPQNKKDEAAARTPKEVSETQPAQANTEHKEHAKQGNFNTSQKFINEAFEQRPSILSSDNKANNYRGFINVCIVLLVLAKFEDMLRNAYKYGILIKPSMLTGAVSGFTSDPYHWPNITIFLSLSIFAALAYALEVGMSKRLPPSLLLFLQLSNAIAAFTLPALGVWRFSDSPGGATVTLLFATVTMMKLWSFALVCPSIRRSAEAKDKTYVPSKRHFVWFMLIPTCIFNAAYPQSERIRRRWVVNRLIEFLLVWFAILFVAVQYIVPGIKNTLRVLDNPDMMRFTEGLVKIAVPNFVIWILGFYAIFHLQLNIMAELLQFGDRQFYRDWWNATTVEYFWKNWNLPVHQWMVAHVYLPLVRNNICGKQLASFSCFLLSAVFHELIVSIPFHNFKLLAFGGMMVQVLLIEITRPLKGKQAGNVIFWLSIILGQPLAVLLYCRDHMKGQSGIWTDSDTAFYSKILGL